MKNGTRLREIREQHEGLIYRVVEGDKWLERDEAPQGYTLRIPSDFETISLTNDGGVNITSTVLEEQALIGKLREEYKRIVSNHSKYGNALQQLPTIQAAIAALEEKKAALQANLTAVLEDARRSLNAWLYFAAPPEAPPKTDNIQYEEERHRLCNTWLAENRGLTQGTIWERRRRQRLWVLEHHTAKPSELLYRHVLSLWGEVCNGRRQEALLADLTALSTHFSVPGEVATTTNAALRYRQGKVFALWRKMAFVDCRRAAYELIEWAVIEDEPIRGWGDGKKEPPFPPQTTEYLKIAYCWFKEGNEPSGDRPTELWKHIRSETGKSTKTIRQTFRRRGWYNPYPSSGTPTQYTKSAVLKEGAKFF